MDSLSGHQRMLRQYIASMDFGTYPFKQKGFDSMAQSRLHGQETLVPH